MRKTASFFYYILCFLLLFPCLLYSQGLPNDSGLFGGVVVDRATSEIIPHATVKNKTQNVDVLADSTGFFSIEAREGDTLIFEAMLYRPSSFIVPEGYNGRQFGFIAGLQQDAVLLKEVEVAGFPSQQQFEQAILMIDPGNVVEKTVVLNEELEDITADKTNMQGYILEANRDYMIYEITGNPQPNNFLNPERWAKFINDWQEGVFTEESIEKLEGFPVYEEDEQEPEEF
ncbi:peptidase associated/transthyretin-like domain-containing protein [Nafulsella turpanensis]|uniref:hypothetical protein n=1 Tax=Nafulsella turpanensis TaxID=1265690 RepID=UPI00034DB81D|nr:hypothetical protein [Nafulsella turpanensis]